METLEILSKTGSEGTHVSLSSLLSSSDQKLDIKSKSLKLIDLIFLFTGVPSVFNRHEMKKKKNITSMRYLRIDQTVSFLINRCINEVPLFIINLVNDIEEVYPETNSVYVFTLKLHTK